MIHLEENIIESDDRRKGQKRMERLRGGGWIREERLVPHDYSKPCKIISVPVKPEPPAEWEYCNNAMKLGLNFVEFRRVPNPKYDEDIMFVGIPYSPHDLIAKPEPWSPSAIIGYPYPPGCLNRPEEQFNTFDPNCVKPASTMPLELAKDCKRQWEVVKVLGVKLLDVCETSCDGDPNNGDPIDEAWSKVWHYNILTRKKVN